MKKSIAYYIRHLISEVCLGDAVASYRSTFFPYIRCALVFKGKSQVDVKNSVYLEYELVLKSYLHDYFDNSWQ